MMHLVEDRKLLDANVFDGRRDIAKPSVINIIVPWIFGIFVSFHFFLHR